ncbi:hypothetical protein ACLBXM_19110 [Xanthobacteraceae bacterium A53D]
MFLKSLPILAAALVSFATADVAVAQTKPNVIVMSDDADKDTVPRDNRIFRRVIQELQETMSLRGYNVYDETAVAMNITQPGRVRRRDAELIDVARAIPNPPMDVVVVFQIFASAQKSMSSDIVRPEVRIPGRILNVRTGQAIGSFEVAGLQLPPLPQGCDRECLLERVGGEAKTLSTDLALALTQKLDGFIAPRDGGATTAPVNSGTGEVIPGSAPATGGTANAACGGMPTAYVVRLSGFTAEEMKAAEEYMRSFSCFESQRPVRSSASQSEYWYETRADSGRLNRNLRLMLEMMDAKGQVAFSGNTFTISRVATR